MAQLVHQPTDLNGPAQFPPAGIEPKLYGKSDGMIYVYTLLPCARYHLPGSTNIVYTKARVVRKFNVADCTLFFFAR